MCRALAAAGGVLGFLAVALGAFGAHALKSRMPADMMAIYQTGVQYHLAHSIAILFAAMAADKLKVRLAGWLWTAGIFIFSGSLYALAITQVKVLGAITPIGGVCFLLGWATIVKQAATVKDSD